jgi:hypothetical protein
MRLLALLHTRVAACACAILLSSSQVAPLWASPGETIIDPHVALAPVSPIDPSEKLIARKGVVFEQPLAWPVAAQLAGHAEAGSWGPNLHRVNVETVLQGRPFSGNFGSGQYGKYAYCGDSEYRKKNADPPQWKPEPGGLCLFDSDGDNRLDEWRPRVPASRFTTKTDPFPPVGFKVVKNHLLPYPLQLIYSGNIVSNMARAFTVKLGEYSPIIVPFEKLREEGDWTILGFQGAELAVAQGPKGTARVRVLKPFDEGAPFAVVTTTTFRVM